MQARAKRVCAHGAGSDDAGSSEHQLSDGRTNWIFSDIASPTSSIQWTAGFVVRVFHRGKRGPSRSSSALDHSADAASKHGLIRSLHG